MADLPPPTELEGGFIHIRAKVYRGTIRRRDNHRIVWTCKHNHYRPEYNARYTHDTNKVWETSGLNCGRAAYRQLLAGEKTTGDPGMVGDPDLPLAMRDDFRIARVMGEDYSGRVRLHESGQRILTVSHSASTLTGTVNLDVPPSKAVRVNSVNTEMVRRWATAAWLLKGAVWGVVFQDPRVSMHSDKVIERAVEELLEADNKPGPKKLAAGRRKPRLSLPDEYDGSKAVRRRKTPKEEHPKKLVDVLSMETRTSDPHIRVSHDEGKRVFEVIGFHEDVVDRFIHRGQAVQRLAEVKERA